MAATKIRVQALRRPQADAFNRVFTLETTQVQQQDNLAVAQGNIALNLINVYRALGGGWQIRCQDGKCCKARITDVTPAEVPPAAEPEQLPQPKTVPQRR